MSPVALGSDWFYTKIGLSQRDKEGQVVGSTVGPSRPRPISLPCAPGYLINSSVNSATKTILAPRLALSQPAMVRDMISSRSLTTSQMAEAAGCSKHLIITINANLRMFGVVRASLIPGGRPRVIKWRNLKYYCTTKNTPSNEFMGGSYPG